ncbi:anaerobic ribonucleoside-triphosphate reductase activating protein [Rhodovulum sulfidophilum]|uniref:Anaerobic ribonucleoside-triphosphate reductase activating protein n=1 Tax=Rhodovulum visakhapatnamense TaxID=364297 RepID=A0ABS1RFZ0_9RHOB|nr:anaerobic ribonucleoside-triphosphate reductase activating protein [Rhodovulum visakhapatnamense]MBL3569775.1 anaerobic ribonucleoside-triphosphate reductase activating protein [Rhodovulum visakhapatnamense]MBL3577857.1 anaerobic ribonucleoside-triphosphate reductase activating protein [Rhodovulum visakhapatnamense]OLS42394.1 anaerobic ribonucleoside-triphosphate reductase activating protein [Rhodovulum sulfidophilum]
MAEIAVAGLVRHSTVDWPGELVATVFCQGCPWACRYCHNPALLAAGPGSIAWAEVMAFLHRRRGLLDGVVISGGEPTLQSDLAAALSEIRALGFRTGLHTGGPYPARLAKAAPLLDWVGFDVKAPFGAYDRITGVPGSGAKARDSLILLRDSGVAIDPRTTVHPALLSAADLARIDAELDALGLPPSRRQPFRAEGCADQALGAWAGA